MNETVLSIWNYNSILNGQKIVKTGWKKQSDLAIITILTILYVIDRQYSCVYKSLKQWFLTDITCHHPSSVLKPMGPDFFHMYLFPTVLHQLSPPTLYLHLSPLYHMCGKIKCILLCYKIIYFTLFKFLFLYILWAHTQTRLFLYH